MHRKEPVVDFSGEVRGGRPKKIFFYKRTQDWILPMRHREITNYEVRDISQLFGCRSRESNHMFMPV